MSALAHIPSGAKFFRADLHIHTYGGSWDVSDATATPENIVAQAVADSVPIIAITDHNSIINVRSAIKAGLTKGIMVVPAVELSTPQGHLLCYLSNIEALEQFFSSTKHS